MIICEHNVSFFFIFIIFEILLLELEEKALKIEKNWGLHFSELGRNVSLKTERKVTRKFEVMCRKSFYLGLSF